MQRAALRCGEGRIRAFFSEPLSRDVACGGASRTDDIIEKLPGAILPAVGEGVRAGFFTWNVERRQRRRPQIVPQHARFRPDDVHWTHHREGRHGKTAGQRLQQDKAKSIGSTREDENIGGGIEPGQLRTGLEPKEMGVRKAGL